MQIFITNACSIHETKGISMTPEERKRFASIMQAYAGKKDIDFKIQNIIKFYGLEGLSSCLSEITKLSYDSKNTLIHDIFFALNKISKEEGNLLGEDIESHRYNLEKYQEMWDEGTLGLYGENKKKYQSFVSLCKEIVDNCIKIGAVLQPNPDSDWAKSHPDFTSSLDPVLLSENIEMIKYFLSLGAQIWYNGQRLSLVGYATRVGRFNVIKALLEAEQVDQMQYLETNELVQYYARIGDFSSLKIELEKENFELSDESKTIILKHFFDYLDNKKIEVLKKETSDLLELLIKKGANLDIGYNNWGSIIEYATFEGFKSLVEIMWPKVSTDSRNKALILNPKMFLSFDKECLHYHFFSIEEKMIMHVMVGNFTEALVYLNQLTELSEFAKEKIFFGIVDGCKARLVDLKGSKRVKISLPEELLDELLKKCENVNFLREKPFFKSIVEYALECSNEELAKFFLFQGVQVTESIILSAIYYCYNDLALELLEINNHLYSKSVFEYAIQMGSYDIAFKYLERTEVIAEGAILEIVKNFRSHFCEDKVCKLIEFALKKGANINATNLNATNLIKKTPLMFAAEKELEKVVTCLLKLGAKKYLRNNEGLTALEYSKSGDISKLLEGELDMHKIPVLDSTGPPECHAMNPEETRVPLGDVDQNTIE